MLITKLIKLIEHDLLPRYQAQETCNQYAWWMLEEITKKSKTQLLVLNHIDLTEAQKAQLADWINKQVILHMPLAYLIGTVPFNNITIDVKPPVLIPRPETEEWVANLIDTLQHVSNKKLTILDLCCGSGCIGLSIAKALPKTQVVAIDISDEALALSKHNAHKNNIANITFVRSDLLTCLPTAFTFDIIVSNPPYIAQSEWNDLDESVRRWEDTHALIAKNDGLALIEQIIKNAPAYLKNNPELREKQISNLYIEIGHLQGPRVKQIFLENKWREVAIVKDLQGKDRMVKGSSAC